MPDSDDESLLAQIREKVEICENSIQNTEAGERDIRYIDALRRETYRDIRQLLDIKDGLASEENVE